MRIRIVAIGKTLFGQRFSYAAIVTLALVAGDQRPYIASDRETLHLASNRAGGLGDNDLYVTIRTKQKPQKGQGS